MLPVETGGSVTLNVSTSIPLGPDYFQWTFIPSGSGADDTVSINTSLPHYSLSEDGLNLQIERVTPDEWGSYTISLINTLMPANATIFLDVFCKFGCVMNIRFSFSNCFLSLSPSLCFCLCLSLSLPPPFHFIVLSCTCDHGNFCQSVSRIKQYCYFAMHSKWQSPS